MQPWKKKFITIWSGQLFSILSSTIAQFAIILWISLETGSAEVLAFATIAGMVPQIILGAFAGVFVDRWNRKWTMILADSFVALCSGVIAWLFYLDVVELWHIYLLLMLRSVGGAFHTPAMKASIPLLAPESELTRIAGINQSIQAVCTICGPVMGAALIVSTNMSVIMLLDVAGAIIACTALLFEVIPNPPKKEAATASQVLKEMREGFTAIRLNRGLTVVMLLEVLVTFFIMPIVALYPLLTLQHFHGTAYQVSIIELLFGFGMLTGGILLGIWNPKLRKVILINISYMMLGLTVLITGLLPASAFIPFAVLTVIQGISIPFYSGPLTSLLQTQIEVSMLGRVFSLFDSISLLPSVLGLLATGFIADNIGISNVFVVCGIALLLVAIIAPMIPSAMNLGRRR